VGVGVTQTQPGGVAVLDGVGVVPVT
jgi:hypothetical protein